MARATRTLLWAGALWSMMAQGAIVDAGEPAPDAAPAAAGGDEVRPGGKDKAKANCLQTLGRWLCYRPVTAGCECKGGPTPYRPPLYTWFPCRPAGCANGVWVPAGGGVQEPVVFRLPQPGVPIVEMKEKPLVPGSSEALAVLVEKKPATLAKDSKLMLPPIVQPRSIPRDKR